MALILSILVITPAGAQVFVDQANVSGVEDGLSWATAYTSIQAAIADPRSENFPIFVAMGIYQENLTLTSLRQLYGGFKTGDTSFEDRKPLVNKTTIEATGPAPRRPLTAIGVQFTMVEGFIIRFGNANGADLDGQGGGALYLATGDVNTIKNCYFDDNMASGDGGGLALMEGSSPRILDCTFIRNTAGDDGGGLYITNGSSPDIQSCAFQYNSAGDRGGGFYVSFNSSPSFVGFVAHNNEAREGGGGFFRDNANAYLGSAYFIDNLAKERGGGAGCTENSTVTFDFCSISQNKIETPSAAIQVFDDASISGLNMAPLGFGGCVYVDTSSPIFINCYFEGSVAQYGGGLGIWNGSPVITNALFQSLFDTPVGGGMYIAGTTGLTTIKDSLFYQTHGTVGSAVFASGAVMVRVMNSEFDGCGSANAMPTNSSVFYINDGATALVEDSLFERNLLSCGYIRQNSTAHFNRCHFIFNNIFSFGSALVAVDNSMTLSLVSNCVFTSNMMNGPGAINIVNSNLDLVNCTIDRNWASSPQSTIHVDGVSYIQIINNIISNSARYGIYRRGELSAAVVDSNLFWNNPAGDYRDEPENAIYDNADEINMHVPGAVNNLSGDPRFEMHDVIAGHFGILDAVAFDNQTFTTLLTDNEAAFPFGALVGRYVYFDNDLIGSKIYANSDEVIAIQGNRTPFIFVGDNYRVLDYRLTRQSAAVDHGRTEGAPPEDFLQLPRPVETTGAGADGRSVDIGAYELQLTNYTPGQAWMLR